MTQYRCSASVMILVCSVFFISAEVFRSESYGSSDHMKSPAPGTDDKRMNVDFSKIPLYFIANEGQVDERAKFYAKVSRYTLWLTKEGLVFDSVKRSGARKSDGPTERPIEVKRNISRLLFVNANSEPEMMPVQETALKVNYFIGADRSKWHCGIPTSQSVLYKGVYDGIDLKVYGIEKQIEYDWIVGPGRDPEAISFTYEGTKGTRIDANGDLLIETGSGQLVHKRPVSYQQIGDMEVAVRVEYQKTGENTYGFVVGAYDKSQALIIDPVVLTYSTCLGGGWPSYGPLNNAIAVDDSGNAYVTGQTDSPDFPTKNQYQTDQGGTDAFVTKIDTTLNGAASLVYSTYLGGGALIMV